MLRFGLVVQADLGGLAAHGVIELVVERIAAGTACLELGGDVGVAPGGESRDGRLELRALRGLCGDVRTALLGAHCGQRRRQRVGRDGIERDASARHCLDQFVVTGEAGGQVADPGPGLGIFVIGAEVMVKTAAVAHGNLTVTVDESLEVSQPGPFARRGQTVVTTQSEVNVEEEDVRMFLLQGGVSLQEIVTAVNRVGAAPGDLIAILEALQQAGALSAQLIII